MMEREANLVLIGMPGAGKSTIGVILAKRMALGFVDTDLLIQRAQGRSLQEIVDSEGYLVLRRIEEEVLQGLDLQGCIIATGGSAVYSERAMAHLKAHGLVAFLHVELPELEARVHNFRTRGLAKRPDQDLEDLFRERLLLYAKYADITITCAGLSQEEVCARVMEDIEGALPRP